MARWVQRSSRSAGYTSMDSAEFTSLESDIYRTLQNVLRELDTSGPQLSKVMLRLTLHQKVHSSPMSCLALVRVAVRELERAERFDIKMHIIPLLHTLIYAVIQAAYVPDELYRRLYGSCKRLLTLPQPFCTVGLSYTRLLKAEISTPGLLYQRTLVSEHRLRNEHYPLQERVFVFADPAVVSESLGSLMRADIEGQDHLGTHLGYMRSVVQHTLQASLGEDLCHGPSFTEALQELVEQDVESFFCKVLDAMEQNVLESKSEQSMFTKTLQQLYTEVLHSSGKDTLSRGSLADVPLPKPEMSFHMWWEEEELWREIAKFVRASSISDSFSLSLDELEMADLPSYLDSDMSRHSVLSTDSGIERDIQLADNSDTETSGGASKADQTSGNSRLSRRGGIRVRPSASDSMALMQDALEESARSTSTLQRQAGQRNTSLLKSKRHFTANVVVLGDDRAAGRLARTYYQLRKMEARKLFLTTKVNIKLFYIPVTFQPSSPDTGSVSSSDSNPCALGSYLGMVDPWYDFNISSQAQMIPQLATVSDLRPHNFNNSFLADIVSYYVRMGQQPVYFTIYYVKIVFCNPETKPVDDVFLSHLNIEFPEFRLRHGTLKDVSKRSPAEICGGLLTLNYRKVSLSNRETEKGLTLRTMGVQMSAVPTNKTEDLNCLTVDVNNMTSKSSSGPKIRTCSLKLMTPEKVGFTVCLDKDFRRVHSDVQSIEVAPCIEPGYYFQKSIKSNSKSMSVEGEDSGLSKYLNRGLLLPINTFSGIVP